MLKPQSTTTRQYRASIDLAAKFTPEQFAALREEQIAELLAVVSGESEHSPDSTVWRDAFCHECDANENVLGTARQLAAHLFDSGWEVTDKHFGNLNCLPCLGV